MEGPASATSTTATNETIDPSRRVELAALAILGRCHAGLVTGRAVTAGGHPASGAKITWDCASTHLPWKDEDDRPPSADDRAVSAFLGNVLEPSVTATADGSFAIAVIGDLDRPTRLVAGAPDDFAACAFEALVPRGGKSDVGTIVLAPYYGRIAGIVRGPDGAPVAGERIKLGPNHGDDIVTTTGTDGRFAVDHVPPGYYLVWVGSADESALGVEVRSGETVEVAIGGVPQVVGRLVVPPGFDLSGLSSWVAAVPAERFGRAGTLDIVKELAAAGGPARHVGNGDRTFAFGGLAPGRYLVGNTIAYTSIDVPPVGTVEAILEPCLIYVRLVAADGAPDPSTRIGAVRTDLLARGLGGDRQALLLSLFGEKYEGAAPEGGAAWLAPTEGHYRIFGRGDRIVAGDVEVEASRSGAAFAEVATVAAPCRVEISGLDPDEEAIALARDGKSDAIVTLEVGKNEHAIHLPRGEYVIEVVRQSGVHQRARVELDGEETVEVKLPAVSSTRD